MTFDLKSFSSRVLKKGDTGGGEPGNARAAGEVPGGAVLLSGKGPGGREPFGQACISNSKVTRSLEDEDTVSQDRTICSYH